MVDWLEFNASFVTIVHLFLLPRIASFPSEDRWFFPHGRNWVPKTEAAGVLGTLAKPPGQKLQY